MRRTKGRIMTFCEEPDFFTTVLEANTSVDLQFDERVMIRP